MPRVEWAVTTERCHTHNQATETSNRMDREKVAKHTFEGNSSDIVRSDPTIDKQLLGFRGGVRFSVNWKDSAPSRTSAMSLR